MYEPIELMVEHLFRNCADTEEVRAARQEITDNCQEHFRDLVSGGMNETEAMEVITDSLLGMEELVKSYPQKSETPDMPENAFDKQEQPAPHAYTAEQVKSLELNPVNHALTLCPSPDGRIHILFEKEEDRENVQVSVADGVLKLSCTDPLMREVGDGFKRFAKEAGETVRDLEDVPGLLRRLGGLLQSSAKRTMKSLSDGAITVQLPLGLYPDCRVSSTGGDVTMDRMSFGQLKVQSVSGDITLRQTAAHHHVRVTSTSGDVEADLAARGSVEVSSISGDVRLKALSPERVSVHTTSGDCHVVPQSIFCELQSVSGDVRVQVTDARLKTLKLHSVSGDLRAELPPELGAILRTSTRSGSLRNTHPLQGSAGCVDLDASTVSGDIVIE